jgi:hypothetical protein
MPELTLKHASWALRLSGPLICPIAFGIARLGARALLVLFEAVRCPQPSLDGRYAAA